MNSLFDPRSNNPLSLRDAVNQMLSEAIWDPFSSRLGDMQDELFDYDEDDWDEFENEFPAIDLRETADSIIVTAEVPGLTDIDIEVDEEVLILEGTLGNEMTEDTSSEDSTELIHAYERYYGSFYREVDLPDFILPEKVTAEIENGLLKVTLPKAFPALPKTKVKVVNKDAKKKAVKKEVKTKNKSKKK